MIYFAQFTYYLMKRGDLYEKYYLEITKVYVQINMEVFKST
nr:MAG TPA: hypothetical protein [Caudoviricetes sp.]